MRRRVRVGGSGLFATAAGGAIHRGPEGLERRLLPAGDLRFAVIGDFSAGQPEKDVSDLVQSWNPSFVVTVGDNNYPDGAASTIDANVGQYYQQYIYPYKGAYGPGSADQANHFFPALGNHDWNTANAQPYVNYFTLPNNERYYDVTQGDVGIFVVDSDPHEPSGDTSTSAQGQWLKGELAASTAKWKLVFFHHPPYSSGGIGNNTWMRWPFQTWGATAVLSGHDHDYERLNVGGLPYFVDGLGGEDIQGFATPVAGSQVRYNGNYGAMLIDAGATSVTFQFVSRAGVVVDTYTVGTPATPVAPTGLTASATSPSQVSLSWTDNNSGGAGFKVERSADGVNYTPVATTAMGVTTYRDSSLSPGTPYQYRVRATTAAGDSAPSNVASATTPVSSLTYVSDLTWVSASNGWGPVEKDMSNGGQAAGDGRPLTLNGVVYPKGLGAHAASTVVYNLAGRYSNFLSDVGVDAEEGGKGSVVFQVLADGVKIYDSGLTLGTSPTRSVILNVAGVYQLSLVVNDGGDGIDYDHADWAGARLTAPSTPTPPAAPTGLSASPSPTQISLMWIDNATTETGYQVERTAGGATFALLATLPMNATAYNDSTVTSGTSYQYRVSASNGAGSSAYSNVVTATLLTPPAAPTGLVAKVVSATQVDLHWTDNATNESGYQVERSTDGTTFTLLASPNANTTAYTDAAVATGTTYTYRVRAVNAAGPSAYSGTASATPSVVALPAPWKDADVGSVALPGGASLSGGTFTVNASGADVWGVADSFHYVYQPLNGDGQIVARVASEQNTGPWAKAGVMIRESLAANAREVTTAITPSNGVAFLTRTTTGGSTALTSADGPVAPYWVKLVRSGSTFTGYSSADGLTWIQVGSVKVSMATNVWIGLVVCAKSNSVSNTSTFDNVSVSGPGVAAMIVRQSSSPALAEPPLPPEQSNTQTASSNKDRSSRSLVTSRTPVAGPGENWRRVVLSRLVDPGVPQSSDQQRPRGSLGAP